MEPLPVIDEYLIRLDTTVDNTWPALVALAGTLRPFTIVTNEPPRTLVLQGNHPLARYELTFTLSPAGPHHTIVRATTGASFAGLPGRLYRIALIHSGTHRFAMGRLLAALRRRVRH